MQSKPGFILATTLLMTLPAFAQEIEARSEPRGDRDPAVEVSLSLGYAQGLGGIGGGQPNLTDIAQGGGELGLSVGYHFSRKLAVGIYGTGSKYKAGNLTPDGSDVWSATAGIQSTWSFAPGARLNPWISSGGGWRGYWVSKPSGTDSRHGLDLWRVQVGLDYRVTPAFSVAPYVGATLSMFKKQQLAHQDGFSSIDGQSLNVFVSGGIAGRFGLFDRGPQPLVIASN